MIYYTPGWGIGFALRLQGSVFPKAAAWAVPCMVLALALHLCQRHLDLDDELFSAGTVGTNIFGGYSFILGFLVVFRSQQAFARWWEGASLLQQMRGQWFDAVGSCMAFSNSAEEMAAPVQRFQHQLVRLVSLLHGMALDECSSDETFGFETLDLAGFDIQSLQFMYHAPDRCEVILQWIQKLIVEAHAANVLNVAPPILSRVYNQLGLGVVVLNNVRRIKDFPIPFAIAQIIPVMLLVHTVVTGLAVATSVDNAAWVCFLSFGVPFAFWSVHCIGVEIEQPFGDDPNDLPLQEMQQQMNASLIEIMKPRARYPPAFDFDAAHHSQLRVRPMYQTAELAVDLRRGARLPKTPLAVTVAINRSRSVVAGAEAPAAAPAAETSPQRPCGPTAKGAHGQLGQACEVGSVHSGTFSAVPPATPAEQLRVGDAVAVQDACSSNPPSPGADVVGPELSGDQARPRVSWSGPPRQTAQRMGPRAGARGQPAGQSRDDAEVASSHEFAEIQPPPLSPHVKPSCFCR